MTAPRSLASASEPLAAQHDLVMLDLDGVVYVGPDAVPGAADVLRQVSSEGVALAYLTNNASRTADTVAQHLRELGMPVADTADVVTSAQAITRLVADALPAGAPVLLIGGEGLRSPLGAAGLRCVESLDDGPAAVVQGFTPDIGWSDLAEASFAVASGLPWFVSNTDSTVPTARGIAPGNGSLVRTVATASGREPTAVGGKPHRPLFDETLERTGARRPLMVGDRLDTDVEGAVAVGITALAVLTGVNDLGDLFACPPGARPDYVSRGLEGLLEPHLEIEVEADRARCGDTTAHRARDEIEVDGPGDELASLRAAVALAWATIDTSGARVVPGATLLA